MTDKRCLSLSAKTCRLSSKLKGALCLAFIVAALAHSAEAAPKKLKSAPQPPGEFLLDAVIASVDEKPITLKELQARLSPPRPISIDQLRQDAEAQQALETLVQERLLEAEASVKKLTVTDLEVDEYINEVAQRNALSRKDFETVLAKEGKSITWYKQQVKNEIYKTKIASNIAKGGVSVSDQEIDEYLETVTSSGSGDATLKLRVITIAPAGRSAEDVATRVRSIEEGLAAGKRFEDLARQFSDDPHKVEGGLLGTVAAKDLSDQIADAVMTLEAGKYTKPVVNERGATQFFFVEERFGGASEGDDDEEKSEESKREDARKAIQRRKTDEKLSSYFGSEIQKNHTVEKKF